MGTYEIYSERGGVKQFQGQIRGEAKAEAWVKWFLEENPGAHAWYTQLYRYDDPAFM